jgi:hypothetical protein
MRGQSFSLVPALAALTCAVLAGCTAGGTSSAARHTPSSSVRPAASGPQATGQIGSPGNPLLLSCAQEAVPGYTDPPIPSRPQPGDLAIGPLFIASGKTLATQNPADHGYTSYGPHHGNSYKIPFVVLPGSTVTVTIGASARGQVVINNPYSPVGGVAAATYHSCSRKTGFFAQGFAFTHGQSRGCVPLEVRIDHQPQVRHVTLSLFAGSCPT